MYLQTIGDGYMIAAGLGRLTLHVLQQAIWAFALNNLWPFPTHLPQSLCCSDKNTNAPCCTDKKTNAPCCSDKYSTLKLPACDSNHLPTLQAMMRMKRMPRKARLYSACSRWQKPCLRLCARSLFQKESHCVFASVSPSRIQFGSPQNVVDAYVLPPRLV